jgi:hypothetical protein
MAPGTQERLRAETMGNPTANAERELALKAMTITRSDSQQ